MQLLLLKAPTQEPVAQQELKDFLRIEHDAEEDLLVHLIRVARQMVENYTNKSLLHQVWRIKCVGKQCQNGSLLTLPHAPVVKVAAINRWWDGQKPQPCVSYSLAQTSRPTIKIKHPLRWAENLQVDVLTGYGDKAIDVPSPLRHAILKLAANLYQNRECIQQKEELPMVLQMLLQPYRGYQIC